MDPSRRPRPDPPIEPLEQVGRSGSDRAPLITLAALAAALVVSVGLAQLFPPTQSAEVPGSPVAAGSDRPTDGASTITPGSLAVGSTVAPRLRAGDLAAGVLDGTLDGRLVYADATLRVSCEGATTRPCPSPRLAIEGLALDVVPDGLLQPLATPPHRAVLVLEVRGSRLAYLGPLVVHADGSPSLADLIPPDPRAAAATPLLTDVAGWLMLDGPCTSPPGAFLPCPHLAMIADDEPRPTGRRRADAGMAVSVPRGTWGVDDAGTSLIQGTFLVRPNPGMAKDGLAWEVVARYDPSRSVRVVIP